MEHNIEKINIEYIEKLSSENFSKLILDILTREKVPSKFELLNVTNNAISILNEENDIFRVKQKKGSVGGVINIEDYKYTVIVPDIHARRHFIKSLLFWRPFNYFSNNNFVENLNYNLLELLEKENFTLLCLGDGVHSEGIMATRWIKAYEEYFNRYKTHKYIDQEICDSFNLMLAIMILKIRFKNKFNFLKGNHENIKNENGGGNYSFVKFANEGSMILEYFKKFYGDDVINSYYKFEKLLPVFAIGRNFLCSHAEPADYFDIEKIINYSEYPGIIEALTWTDNNQSIKGTIEKYLNNYTGNSGIKKEFYFGGHRPIKGFYNRINNDRYVQIHNPNKYIVAFIDGDSEINLDQCIVEVPDYESINANSDKTIDNENSVTSIDYLDHFQGD